MGKDFNAILNDKEGNKKGILKNIPLLMWIYVIQT